MFRKCFKMLGYRYTSRSAPCKYRLPTEAEWEYSARAGGKTKYYWGDSINDAYLWYYGNSGYATHLVGKKKPNAWGLYDMIGNVWEWVGDWYDDSYYKNSPSADQKGAISDEYRVSRVIRGGPRRYRDAGGSRLSMRGHDYFDNRGNYCGFRLVLLP